MSRIHLFPLHHKTEDAEPNAAVSHTENKDTQQTPAEEKPIAEKPSTPPATPQELKTTADKGAPFWAFAVDAGEVLGIANRVVKFGWEHNTSEETPYASPFVAIPFAKFPQRRLGLSNTEDKTLRSIEVLQVHVDNFADLYDHMYPLQLRSNGNLGYGVGLLNQVTEPSVKLGDTTGLISSQRREPFFVASNLTYAGLEMSLAGLDWKASLEPLEFSCTDWKASVYPGGADACAEHMSQTANGSDWVIGSQSWSDNSAASNGPARDVEGVEGMALAAYEAHLGQSTARYYLASSLWIKNTENRDGHLTPWSASILIPAGAEILANTLSGHSLNAEEYAARGGLVGAGLFFNAITTTPQIDNALANNGTFAVMGPSYPLIMVYANTPKDTLKFSSDPYDNPTSIFNVVGPAATGLYLYGHLWAGVNAGMSLKIGKGLEKFGPLAQMGLGIGSEFVSNAISGDPKFVKYGLAGLGGAALTTGLFYWLGDKPIVTKTMKFNPMIAAGPDGAYISVDLASGLRKDRNK